MVSRRLAAILAILMLALLPPEFGQAQDNRRPVKMEGKEVLTLRVLARPFSNVYKEKDTAAGTVMENVPVFQPFHVYTRPTAEELEMESGWYEVGTDNRGTVTGWMQARDVFEWKQTMCLAYTHPEGRRPVLMFDRKSFLENLIKSPPEERTRKAADLYQAIDSKQVPPDFPVKSVEPKKAIDISEQFYLLPILDFQVMELDGREGRLLRLAAATGAGPDAREETDIRKDTEYLQQAVSGATETAGAILKKLTVDVVWVMDTTVSMRPYIQKTLEVVRNVSEQISKDPEVAGAIRFGFWGYRDSVNDIPGIGYTTMNYTSELKPIDQFIPILADIKVTEIDSVDYPEDVFSGVDDAIRKTMWTPGAIKIMILAGDAPSHTVGHPWNLSGQSEATLRSIADDESVYLFSLHVKEPKAKKFHEPAEIQYRALGRNKGMVGESAYWSTSSNDIEGFAKATADLTSALTGTLQAAKKGEVAADLASSGTHTGSPTTSAPAGLTSAQPGGEPRGELAGLSSPPPITFPQSPSAGTPAPQQPTPGATGQPSSTAGKLAGQMIRAALVEWIGSQAGAKAPRDIVAWAVDKDLTEPSIQSMEVRLLINKRQLDSLKTILTEVMAAGRRGQIGGEDFFSALQATAATAARDPNQIKNAKTMAQTGLLPEFLKGLPYKSRLMDMSNELWGSWSVDEQDQFLNELEARIKAYQAIHDAPQGWVPLNKGDDPDEHVYPISLELLP